MRKIAEQALDMMNLVGSAIWARPNVDHTEACRYYRRLLQLICISGEEKSDPAVFSTTETGKQLTQAAALYVRMMNLKPDPDQLDRLSCMSEFKTWYETVLRTAAGVQQEYELNSESGIRIVTGAY